MPLLQEAIQKLKKSDLKTTERRLSMLELMYKENRYLSAKEVKDSLEEFYPNISPDTIYRNLHSFSRLEILEESELDGEKVFRSNCGVEKHHHHFICTNCGFSKELTSCPLFLYEDELGEVEVTSHRFELLGLCKECLKLKENKWDSKLDLLGVNK